VLANPARVTAAWTRGRQGKGEPAVGDALGDVWCDRAELLLVSCFPAASPRRQASIVADVTGKTSAQRWRDTSRASESALATLLCGIH
jgi:hypothetical protein